MAEKEAFITLFEKAKAELGPLLKSITTDGNLSIRAFMKKDQSGVKHGLDIWHINKNLDKNLKAKCRTKVSCHKKTMMLLNNLVFKSVN